jgi:hypothetical protein
MSSRIARYGGLLLALAGLVAAVALPGAAAASPRGDSSTRVRIDVFGDSLADQASNYLAGDLNPAATTLDTRTVGGSALCDFVYPDMRTTPGGLVDNATRGPILKLTRATAPRVAVLEFSGNDFTPCIESTPFNLTTFDANYAYNLRAAIAHLRSIGTREVLIDAGPHTAGTGPIYAQLVTLYRAIAERSTGMIVRYAGAADRSVLTANGQFTQYLPCLGFEVKQQLCGDVIINGVENDKVRSDDGIHFCPVTVGNSLGQVPVYCPVYSSGAYRYALALATLVWRAVPHARAGTSPWVRLVTPSVGSLSGGTRVEVEGTGMGAVVRVEFVKLYFHTADGVKVTAGSPYAVDVPGTHVARISSTELLVTAPALDSASPSDGGNVFVEVVTMSAESVLGLQSDAFNES